MAKPGVDPADSELAPLPTQPRIPMPRQRGGMSMPMPGAGDSAANPGQHRASQPMPGMDMGPRSPAMGPATMIPPAMLPPAHRRLAPSSTGYTLPQLIDMALGCNPTLAQAIALVNASQAKSLQAGLMPNPLIGYVSEQMGAGGGPGETQGAFLEQEVFRGGKLRLSRAKYRQEAVQAEMQVEAQRLRITSAVRIRYFEVLAAQQHIEIERELLANHEELQKTTREMANVGQANRPDVLQAQVAAQRQRVKLRAAENRFKKTWEALRSVVGAPDLPISGVVGALEADLPPLSWPEALRHLLEHSPQLKVARAEVLRDEITVQRERVQPIPNAFLRVETGYNWEVNLTTVGVQYGWNFPILN